ncbi:hypothetical protein [Thalassobacillus hwangdonensis]|uniref:Uncharacterized protein n=1 Tax=Thalassobacillus hwangdonensis TaxID=546108 RepID=A0ABW3L0W9_9BACI
MKTALPTIIGVILLYVIFHYRFRLLQKLLALQLLRKCIAVFLVNMPTIRERLLRQTFL